MKKFRPHIMPISFLVVLSVVVHHAWFTNLSPMTYGDWYIAYSEKLREYFTLPLIWNSDYALGSPSLGLSFWPFLFFSGFLSILNPPPFLIERVVFFWPLAILLPLGSYYLSYYILRSRIAALISGLIFEFNTYVIILQGGHLTLLMAISFTPFFLLFFLKTLFSNKLFYAAITALIGFVISFYEFRIFYLAVWLIFFYLIYHLTILKEFKGFKDFIKKLALALIIVVIILLLNLYFLLGIFGLEALTNNTVFNRTLFGTWYITLAKTMTIFHFGWTGGVIIPWKIQPLLIRFYLIPLLAIFGFIVGRKNKLLPFFAFLGILGIFLAKQNTPPFPDIYQWLFDRIPGFNAFRESGKFLLYVAISYSILVGAFISWLWNRSETTIKKSTKIATIFFIVFIIIWNAKPIVTGELGALFVPRKIPNDYLILNQYLTPQKEYFRTLWTPDYSRWGHYSNNHPRTSALYLGLYEWSDLAKKGNPIGSEYFNQLLDITSIKYLIVPLQDKANEDDFFPQSINRKDFILELERLPYLKKVNIGMREVVLFENYNYRPHLYLTQNKEKVNSAIFYETINYTSINSTEYRVFLENINNPVNLNFSENYHPSWKLRIGEFNWYKVFFDKNYFISDKLHFKNDTGLNSFIIDPKTICKFNTCIQNPDGSYNINLTLYFKPQSFVYLGLIISLTVLFFIIVMLSITLTNRKI